MSARRDNEMDPRAALAHAQMVEDRVRKRGRWHGWVWLTVALITPLFLIGVNAQSVPESVQFWIAIGYMVVGAVLAFWEARRGLWGREAAEADRPFTWAYVVSVFVFAGLTVVFDPTGAPAWLVALGLAPSIPCSIAAWRILTR